jgi:hypothetical protein
VTSHTITASDRGQPLAPIAGLGCRALAGSRLLGSSLAFAIMTATGGTIITASDVMIAAVTGEDPHDRRRCTSYAGESGCRPVGSLGWSVR